jgi:hypothetical protein
MQHPIDVALDVAARRGEQLDVPPGDRGPFGWSDPVLVTPVLEAAGWRDVSFELHTLDLYVCGPGPVERIVDTSLGMGGLRAALVDRPPELVDAVRAALAADYSARHDGTGVLLEGAVAVVRAWNRGA